MTRLLFSLWLFFFAIASAAVDMPAAPRIEARAWMLLDAASGATLAAHDAERPLPPASLTKLMTSYLVFEALRDGKLSRDSLLNIDDKPMATRGARMFLAANQKIRVVDLIRGMLVISANDAAARLAVAVAGSEESFVKRMNETAARLGMRDSRFRNVTGQHDSEHVASARDLTKLALALMRDFPQDYAFFSIKRFEYAGLSHENKNRLLWLDPNIDGLKTGQTNAAGYCLAASTRRDNRRLVVVILGANSEQARALDAQRLLNFGLQAYETLRLYPAKSKVTSFRVYKGKGSQLDAGFLNDFSVTVPRGAATELKADILARQPLMAPIRIGDTVATLRLNLGGQPYLDAPLVALDAIPVGNVIGRLWDSAMLLLK
jgi:D-alanyl-D-alanine carboxypeptidase (penicillin-binding protein 5/6)